MSVTAVKWLGICDLREEPSPEERDSAEEAQADVDQCPCRYESGPEPAECMVGYIPHKLGSDPEGCGECREAEARDAARRHREGLETGDE